MIHELPHNQYLFLNIDKIYAEFFTSRLFGSSFDEIEAQIGKKIEVLVRGEVEEES